MRDLSGACIQNPGVQSLFRGEKTRKYLTSSNDKFRELFDSLIQSVDLLKLRDSDQVSQEIKNLIHERPFLLNYTTSFKGEVATWKNIIKRMTQREKSQSPVSLDGIFFMDDFEDIPPSESILLKYLEEISLENFLN